MPSLALKASVNYPFIGGSSGPTYDTDAAAWFAAVAANGGTITTANKTAFNTAFLALKSTNSADGNSLWSHINQGYWFVGQESLTTGLFVPFYNTNTGSGLQPIDANPATNNGFSNYSKTAGLTGNNTTSIQPAISNNSSGWPVSTRHLYGYFKNVSGKLGTPVGGLVTRTGSGPTANTNYIGMAQAGWDSSGRWYGNVAMNYGQKNVAGSVALGNTSSGFSASDGGWGIISNTGSGAYNIRGGSDTALFADFYNSYTSGTATLNSSQIYFNNGGASTGGATIAFASIGTGFYTPISTDGTTDFLLIDNIVSTLISSLT